MCLANNLTISITLFLYREEALTIPITWSHLAVHATQKRGIRRWLNIVLIAVAICSGSNAEKEDGYE